MSKTNTGLVAYAKAQLDGLIGGAPSGRRRVWYDN